MKKKVISINVHLNSFYLNSVIKNIDLEIIRYKNKASMLAFLFVSKNIFFRLKVRLIKNKIYQILF